jgi:hypothetical protein
MAKLRKNIENIRDLSGKIKNERRYADIYKKD